MKKIAIISLAVVLILIPVLAMNCGSNGDNTNLDIKSPQGKIKWIETQPLVSSYSESRSADEAYAVTIGGELALIGNDTVEMYSVIIRLYNSSDGVVDDDIDDRSLGDPVFSPTSHYTTSFTKYFAEDVVRYEVFVTDSEGTEYACVTD